MMINSFIITIKNLTVYLPSRFFIAGSGRQAFNVQSASFPLSRHRHLLQSFINSSPGVHVKFGLLTSIARNTTKLKTLLM